MRSCSLDFAAVRLKLLAAIGASPLAVAACGGSVVFVDDGGGGQGGDSPTTSTVGVVSVSSASSVVTTSGTFTCDEPDAIYACNHDHQGPCPPAGSSEARELMSDVLAWEEECDEWCYCSTFVSSVPCGPDPYAPAGCCYYAVTGYEEICMGRPFTVEGASRVAPNERRDDWSEAIQVSNVGLSPEARRALAAAWTQDALYEHASVASFARFTLELLSLGAPAHLLRRAQQAMADEIRHAELCFSIARALGGDPVGPGPLPIEDALSGRRDPRALLEALIREGCVGETLSALVAAAARDAATAPAVRAALGSIAADELAHAELAWATVAWARAAASPDLTKAIDDALDACAATLSLDLDPEVDTATLHAYGRLTLAERRAIMQRGFDDVVLPLARAMRSGEPSPAELVASLGGHAGGAASAS